MSVPLPFQHYLLELKPLASHHTFNPQAINKHLLRVCYESSIVQGPRDAAKNTRQEDHSLDFGLQATQMVCNPQLPRAGLPSLPWPAGSQALCTALSCSQPPVLD